VSSPLSSALLEFLVAHTFLVPVRAPSVIHHSRRDIVSDLPACSLSAVRCSDIRRDNYSIKSHVDFIARVDRVLSRCLCFRREITAFIYFSSAARKIFNLSMLISLRSVSFSPLAHKYRYLDIKFITGCSETLWEPRLPRRLYSAFLTFPTSQMSQQLSPRGGNKYRVMIDAGNVLGRRGPLVDRSINQQPFSHEQTLTECCSRALIVSQSFPAFCLSRSTHPGRRRPRPDSRLIVVPPWKSPVGAFPHGRTAVVT
jgi:hypothetical protein